MRGVRAAAALPDLPPPEAPPDEVRRIADEVVADPVFDRPGPGLVARARQELGELVQDALDALLEGGGSAGGWAVVVVLVAVVALLAVRFARGVQRDPGSVADAGDGAGRPVTDWSREAARLEAQGEWRAALRSRYRGMVAALAASGVVDDVPGRTAGEHRAQVARTAPQAAAEFDSATALFEGAWYGGRPVGATEAGHLAALAERVVATAGGRS